MDAQDLFWLAGLLEGEGHFTPGRQKVPYPAIHLSMTDEDVVQSVAELLGIRVYSRSRGQYKKSYQCMLRGLRAIDSMRELRPIMGQRRQQQIDLAISSHEPYKSSTHNWSTKLDVRAVLDIYTRALSSGNQRAIAEEYGIDKSIVSCIKNGKLWSSVTGAKPK